MRGFGFWRGAGGLRRRDPRGVGRAGCERWWAGLRRESGEDPGGGEGGGGRGGPQCRSTSPPA